MEYESENIELGRQEIWRREKLFIATIFSFIPYCIIIVIPISKLFGNFSTYFLVGLFLIFIIFVHHWYATSPCPNCGENIFTPYKKSATRYRKCIHCKIDLRPTGKIGYSITFKETHYKPGKTNTA